MATLSRLDTEGHLPNDGYYRTVGTVGLDHFFSDKAKLRFLYHANQNRYDIPGPAHQGYTEPDKYGKNTEQLIGARAHLHPFSWLEYVPRLSFYFRDTLFENKPDAVNTDSDKTDSSGTRLHLDNQINVRLSGEQLGFRGLRRSISTLGVEWEEEDISIESASQNAFGSSMSKYDSKRRAVSFYAQQQFQFQKGLTLAGGVRLDDFDVGEDEVTGKISASYKIPGNRRANPRGGGRGNQASLFRRVARRLWSRKPELNERKAEELGGGFRSVFREKKAQIQRHLL